MALRQEESPSEPGSEAARRSPAAQHDRVISVESASHNLRRDRRMLFTDRPPASRPDPDLPPSYEDTQTQPLSSHAEFVLNAESPSESRPQTAGRPQGADGRDQIFAVESISHQPR
ncbi:unnamed protein product [Darwinula stevensoni]|uniref:Uncharacterized protein n=1 Tax=Darwinula stevensoni TaxID=69355 RepID=A0A7R8XG81_9CRUS|nr:unnamed protein product [Darwinula stevensoni]CAG0889476.1 unnamed protein product [Darwinula stevensoni]